MIKIFYLDQIKNALKDIDPIQFIEEGFIAYSQGKVVVPPVGEILFDKPPGEVHIKYGFIKGNNYYVIKIASGFYENSELGLSVNNGLMLLFKQKSGELVSVLLDEGYLTNIRTAAAGAVAAKYLAPKDVNCIGIMGSGVQARYQLQYLKQVVSCRNVIVLGLNQKDLDLYKNDMELYGFNVKTTLDSDEVMSNCNLIVTTTTAKSPLIKVDQVKKGTHITAVGSDTPEKNELDPKILGKADIFVADSISQCILRGEIHHAIKKGVINKEMLVELGDIIVKKELQRTSDEQITVADLTGVAVQDIQITRAVYEALTS